VDVLCEGACVYHRYNKQPIEIGRLQRHAMDAFLANGRALPKASAPRKPGKVACIGAGPASLACAAELCQRGFTVTVFDRKPLPGGLNTYGVAEYKLRPADSLREIEMIRGLGVEFRLAIEITAEALGGLETEFDAIFLGVGLGAMHKLGISGEDHPSVTNALDFIERYKTAGDLAVGSRVVVIGAGNTAIDAARAARRLGAQSVQILYRRDRQHMAAFSFEYQQAVAEGVEFRWWTQPVAIQLSASQISSITCVRMLSTAGNSLEEVADSEFDVPCDTIIPAIGQSPLLRFLESCRGVRVESGRVQVDRATGQTAHPQYFAGGDCVNGGREVVDAVADGKRSALAISRKLEAAHG